MHRIDCVQRRIPVIVQGDFDPMARQMLGVFDELMLAAARRNKGPRVSIKQDAHGNGISSLYEAMISLAGAAGKEALTTFSCAPARAAGHGWPGVGPLDVRMTMHAMNDNALVYFSNDAGQRGWRPFGWSS